MQETNFHCESCGEFESCVVICMETSLKAITQINCNPSNHPRDKQILIPQRDLQ